MDINLIPDILGSRAEYSDSKKNLGRIRSKLKRLYKTYSFFEEIVEPNCKGDELEIAISKLFSNLGFKIIIPPSKRDLDIYLKYNDSQIGIEIKGESSLGENEIFQVHKYAQRIINENRTITLHPLLIWNNSKYKNEFSSEMITDAKINKYGIMTTDTLQVGFLKFKQNKFSKELFFKILTQIGLVKFSYNNIKRIESGDGVLNTNS